MIDLASLYQHRWKIETAFAQLKTQLGEALALRSKTPELVMQEFYALLMAHTAIRGLMSAAAIRTDQASEDLSFVHTVNVLRRRLSAQAGLPPEPPEQRQIWLDSVLAEIAAKPSVKSRGKTHPRGIKRKMSGFPLRVGVSANPRVTFTARRLMCASAQSR